MPKGKILMGKTPKPVMGKKPPTRGKPVGPGGKSLGGGKQAAPVGKSTRNTAISKLVGGYADKIGNSAKKPLPTPKGKSSAKFPRGMDWAGSPIRPGVDKMSPTGTTTGSILWRDRKSTGTQGVGSTNAGRAYGKGVDARNAELGKRPMGEYLKKPKQRGKVSGPDAIVGKGKQPKKNLFGR